MNKLKTSLCGFAIFLLLSGIHLSNIKAQTTDFKDPFYKDQYYLQSIHAIEARQLQPNAFNVVVALLDDGVFATHPDLGVSLWKNPKEPKNDGKDDGWKWLY